MEKLEITHDELIAMFRKSLAERFAIEQEKAVKIFAEHVQSEAFRAELSASLKEARL